ncbi:MAG TPA: type II secretion system protein GspK [Pseudomonadota bacterium]|nr:type II secretion system protein GspK [Pseudomonadota bacterium]
MENATPSQKHAEQIPTKKIDRTRRQRGVAILTVLVSLALLGATTADLAYNAQVEMEAAANSRDMLRAEYLANSGIELAKLLIVVQSGLQNMLQTLPPEFRDAIVITDFAGFLAQAFGGDKEARDGLGAMVGIDLSGVEGMGTPKGTSFDLAITSEEGRFPINCAGGYNPSKEVQRNLYLLLDSLVRPPRFDRLFNVADRDGVVINREDVATNIIDWTDVDVFRYSPLGAGTASEETYDKGRDRYEPHNMYFDTVEEMVQVRGVSEELWGYLGDFFTVYGTAECKVLAPAMEPTAWPLLAAMLGASAVDRSAVFDPNTSLVAQQVAGMLKTGLPMLKSMAAELNKLGACKPDPRCATSASTTAKTATTTKAGATAATPPPTDTIESLSNLICSSAIERLPQMAESLTSMTGMAGPPKLSTPLRPIALCPGMLSRFLRDRQGSASTSTGGVSVGVSQVGQSGGKNPRRFFRIDATGSVQRSAQKTTQVHIRGVWDSQSQNSNPICTNHPSCFRNGTWMYYRID